MNEYESINKYISILKRYYEIFQTEQLKEYDISSGQLKFLYTLYYDNGIIQETMAKRFFTDKSNVARQISKLEKAGLVSKQVDEMDKRNFRVYLTDKGYALQETIENMVQEWMNIMLKDFSKQESKETLAILNRMTTNVLKASIEEEKL